MLLVLISLCNHVSVKNNTSGFWEINKCSRSVVLLAMLRAFKSIILSYDCDESLSVPAFLPEVGGPCWFWLADLSFRPFGRVLSCSVRSRQRSFFS